jgi:hypothetical protein
MQEFAAQVHVLEYRLIIPAKKFRMKKCRNIDFHNYAHYYEMINRFRGW